jgi:phage terminase large subunit GpA-like protein
MQIANPQRIALETVSAALEPPPTVDYLAWAEANISFDEGQFPGPYNRAAFPFWDEVLRALRPDDSCRYVTVMASAQSGKTTLSEIFCLATLSQSRGSFLVVHPTTDNAVRWSKMKLAPMMRSTRRGARTVPAAGQRFNSVGSLQRTARRPGPPADHRREFAGVAVAGDDRKSGSRRRFKVRSEHHGRPGADGRQPQPRDRRRQDLQDLYAVDRTGLPRYTQLPRRYAGVSLLRVSVLRCRASLEPDNFLANIDPANPDDAHFVCSHCNGKIEEFHRPQMLCSFEWRAHNPAAAREHRSFWIWSCYSFLQSWGQIAREYLRAKGDPASEKTFWNDALGKA